jgi:hypothetical protein
MKSSIKKAGRSASLRSSRANHYSDVRVSLLSVCFLVASLSAARAEPTWYYDVQAFTVTGGDGFSEHLGPNEITADLNTPFTISTYHFDDGISTAYANIENKTNKISGFPNPPAGLPPIPDTYQFAQMKGKVSTSVSSLAEVLPGAFATFRYSEGLSAYRTLSTPLVGPITITANVAWIATFDGDSGSGAGGITMSMTQSGGAPVTVSRDLHGSGEYVLSESFKTDVLFEHLLDRFSVGFGIGEMGNGGVSIAMSAPTVFSVPSNQAAGTPNAMSSPNFFALQGNQSADGSIVSGVSFQVVDGNGNPVNDVEIVGESGMVYPVNVTLPEPPSGVQFVLGTATIAIGGRGIGKFKGMYIAEYRRQTNRRFLRKT